MSDNNNRPKRKILESALQEGVHRKEVAGGVVVVVQLGVVALVVL